MKMQAFLFSRPCPKKWSTRGIRFAELSVVSVSLPSLFNGTEISSQTDAATTVVNTKKLNRNFRFFSQLAMVINLISGVTEILKACNLEILVQLVEFIIHEMCCK